MQLEREVAVKLGSVFSRLCEFSGNGPGAGDLTQIEDDTILQKLHTQIHDIIQHENSEGLKYLSEESGLFVLASTVLNQSVISNPNNSSTVAFVIKLIASVVEKEERFEKICEDKKLSCQILISLDSIRQDSTLYSAALTWMAALVKHQTGVDWILSNGLWEKLLLPCLSCSSIFVQRQGVETITKLLIALKDKKEFDAVIQDIMLVGSKLCEVINRTPDHEEQEQLRQGCKFLTSIIQQLYVQTLGVEPFYSKMNNVDNINEKMIRILTKHKNLSADQSLAVCDVIIINSLHKFCESLMDYGILEQFMLDSLAEDFLTMAKLMLSKDEADILLRASVKIHVYWRAMVDNLKENKNIDLAYKNNFMLMITYLQLTSIVTLYKKSLVKMLNDSDTPKCMEKLMKWDLEIKGNISFRGERKKQMEEVFEELYGKCKLNVGLGIRLPVVVLNSITSIIASLNESFGVWFFQSAMFLLLSQNEPTAAIRSSAQLQKSVIDAIRILVEHFRIDWRKTYVSVCAMKELLNMIQIQGITTQVKLVILAAVRVCIDGFLAPVMSMLMDSDSSVENSVETLGKMLPQLICDLEWEVRDSAIEVLLTCMSYSKDKYPSFVTWMLRYKLNECLLSALRDVEGYVRASAINVLAKIVVIDKIWFELCKENLPHRALAMVLHEEDTSVRRAALTLCEALFIAQRYSVEEVNELLVPVIQAASEDSDHEVRLMALCFICLHVDQCLTKAGRVDGEFPPVIFSKGKIVKLDKNEIALRVLQTFEWFCECGYFYVLWNLINDPSQSVSKKAYECLSSCNELVHEYELQERVNDRIGDIDEACREKKLLKDPFVNGKNGSAKVVTVAGHPVMVPHNTDTIDLKVFNHSIDEAIKDILKTSNLEAVTRIQKPGYMEVEQLVKSSNMVITSKDVPPSLPPIGTACMIYKLKQISGNRAKTDSGSMTELVSLLDDILLEAGTQYNHLDNQKMPDCY